MHQTSESSKKPSFGPNSDVFDQNLRLLIFGQVLPPLVVRHCSKLSYCAI